jgi:hypothetical protein
MKALAINRNVQFIVALVVALISLGGTAAGQQAVLTADSYTSVSSANNNFGANPSLQISTGNASYIRFDLSKAFPSGTKAADVSGAVVKFYVGKVTAPGKFDIYPITLDWGERTISYNNAPTVGAAVATQQIGRDDQGNYITIDITDLVKRWIGDGQTSLPNYGFAMAAHPVDSTTPQLIDAALDSKENSQTSHDGLLSIVTTRPAAGLQTVARDSTLTGDGTPNSPLGVAPGSITSAQLADGAVTADKIATGSVTAAKIVDQAVTGDKIQNGAITSNKIAAPLSLFSTSAVPTLTLVNFGTGPSLNTNGEINTNLHYSLGGERILGNTGTFNLFAGVGAGQLNTGQGNSFFGAEAGKANTSGFSNSFFGSMAGWRNTTGGQNSFFGLQAGELNTTGTSNSFFGFQAGFHNNGDLNSFFGEGAGLANTTGSENALFGASAGRNNTTGIWNSFFGGFAGNQNTTGGGNSFFGRAAGLSNTTGVNNSFFGKASGIANTTACCNSFFGADAGHSNTTGGFNDFYGQNAGYSNTTGVSNVFIGSSSGSGNTTGQQNTYLGASAGQLNETGGQNTMIGNGAGYPVRGTGNTFVGQGTALLKLSNEALTAGDNLTALGRFATFGQDGLTNSTAIGFQALANQSNSLVLGSVAGFNQATATVNVGIGTTAPKARLHVRSGKIYVEANGQGVVLKSPNGSCFELTVQDTGALTTTVVSCP